MEEAQGKTDEVERNVQTVVEAIAGISRDMKRIADSLEDIKEDRKLQRSAFMYLLGYLLWKEPAESRKKIIDIMFDYDSRKMEAEFEMSDRLWEKHHQH